MLDQLVVWHGISAAGLEPVAQPLAMADVERQ
jgi:hypothetical protein